MNTPTLACPECGVDLIPAHGRGRYDADGNYLEHRDGCRCPYCEWMWFDDKEPVKCSCGVSVAIDCDDGHAHAYALEEK